MPRTKTQLLDPIILESALGGLEIQRDKLGEQIAQVRALLGRHAPGRSARRDDPDSERRPRPRRRKLSKAARKRIATAQRKRWAALKAEQQAK
jgi:hypothetical protein